MSSITTGFSTSSSLKRLLLKRHERQKRRSAICRRVSPAIPANSPCRVTPLPKTAPTLNKHADELELNLYTNEKSYTFYVKEDATDDDAIAAAESAIGMALTDQQKEQVRSIRQTAYAGRYGEGRKRDYEGGYWGEEKLTRSVLPEFLKQDELTDWLFTYQMPGAEAYLYSLEQFKSTGSLLWLMTAMSKADKASTGLPRLIEAAGNVSSTSPAFTTIAYHHARVLLEQGKSAEARQVIDEMLNAGDSLPLSSRNSFMDLRLHLAETLEDWLKYSLKKPYASISMVTWALSTSSSPSKSRGMTPRHTKTRRVNSTRLRSTRTLPKKRCGKTARYSMTTRST
jgi:hypothetical protein